MRRPRDNYQFIMLLELSDFFIMFLPGTRMRSFWPKKKKNTRQFSVSSSAQGEKNSSRPKNNNKCCMSSTRQSRNIEMQALLVLNVEPRCVPSSRSGVPESVIFSGWEITGSRKNWPDRSEHRGHKQRCVSTFFGRVPSAEAERCFSSSLPLLCLMTDLR